MVQVTVQKAICALERTLHDLKKLPATMPVQGNFDEGGYTDSSWELKKFKVNVNAITQKILDEDFDPKDPDSPKPYVEITAVFVG